MYISISHSSQVVPTLLVQGPHFEHQGNEHLPFALAETLSTLLCARRSCMDGVTQIFKTPYLGGPIIITTILQLSKFSWERSSNLPQTTQQSVMGLGFGLRKVCSKAELQPTKLSCPLVSQQPARNLCAGKSWTRHEETWTQNLTLHLCVAWPWISHFALWAYFLICLPCKVVLRVK